MVFSYKASDLFHVPKMASAKVCRSGLVKADCFEIMYMSWWKNKQEQLHTHEAFTSKWKRWKMCAFTCSLIIISRFVCSFRAMLQMGASKPWPDALEALTGTRQMNARAIRDYFEPLEKWLQETNRANGDVPGWSLKRVQSQAGSNIWNEAIILLLLVVYPVTYLTVKIFRKVQSFGQISWRKNRYTNCAKFV